MSGRADGREEEVEWTDRYVVAYGWYSQWSNSKLAALNGLRYSVWTSRGAGLVLAFDGGLILVPSKSPFLLCIE